MARCPVCGARFDDRAPHDPSDHLWDELPCGSRRTYCSRRCATTSAQRRRHDRQMTARREREQRTLTDELAALEAAGQQRLPVEV